MPNYIKNRLEILGSEIQVNKIRDFIKGEPDEDGSEMFIDFDKIIKMPDELLVESTSHDEVNQFLLFGAEDHPDNCNIEDYQNLLKRLTANLTYSEIESALKLQANYEKFGYSTSYYWRCGNWGSIRNAFNQTSLSNSVINFDTVSCAVPTIILRLSKKFDDVTFKYLFYDLNLLHDGYEPCSFEIKNGEIINISLIKTSKIVM